MEVLHIVGSLDKSAGGPSRSVPQSCAQVSNLDISVQLIARPSDDPVDIIPTPEFQIRFLSIWNLFRYGLSISKKDISLVHLQHVWDPYIHIMAWWVRVKGIPYIITPSRMLEPLIMNHNPWIKKDSHD